MEIGALYYIEALRVSSGRDHGLCRVETYCNDIIVVLS